MLFKDKYSDRFSSGIANMTIVYACNSATGIHAIWDTVRDRFYSQGLGGIVAAVQENLHTEDLLSRIGFQPSQTFVTLLNQREFETLILEFFDYYVARLPILLKVRITHNGRKRRLSSSELARAAEACVSAVRKAYPQAAEDYRVSGEYAKFRWLASWYVRSERRDDAVYSVKWLIDCLLKLYPELGSGDNVGSVTTHVIEECFPMFWDSFQARHFKNMTYMPI